MFVPRLSVFGMRLPIATNALALWADPPYPGVEPCREGRRLGQKDSATRQRLRNLALGAATRLVRTFPKCPIRLLRSDPERGVAAQIVTGDSQSSRASLDPRYESFSAMLSISERFIPFTYVVILTLLELRAHNCSQ